MGCGFALALRIAFSTFDLLMTRLHPSFLRVLLKVGVFLGISLGFCYVASGHARSDSQTTFDDISGIAVACILFPTFIWFAFVPKVIEFSDREITLETFLGKSTYTWDSDLYCYGPGRNVFMIKFAPDRQPYQIFAGAYSGEEWKKLTDLLNARFSDRKMAYYVGTQMFPRK